MMKEKSPSKESAMYPAVTNTVMRKADFDCIAAGTPATELMYRAGKAIFAACDWTGGETAILCGTGNNGGDGYVLALLLTEAGYPCTIIPAEEKWSSDGRFYYDKCLAAGIPIRFWDENIGLSGYACLVDCLFGTGFHGTLTSPYADMIRAANGSGVPIVAVDIPSGLHGDSGLAAPDENGTPLCIRADMTVSIGTRKVGQVLAMAKDMCGRVVNCDIGIPVTEQTAYVCEDGDFQDILPERVHHSHKGTYGYVAVMGGCRNYSGAVKLANLAASSLRSGCGVVKLLCANSVLPSVAPYLLESTAVPLPDVNGDMVFAPDALAGALSGTAALAVGMGWGSGGDNEKILTWLLENYDKTLILDADGLNCLGRMDSEKRQQLLQNTPADVILTPHPKEFERISGIPMGQCAADPVRYAMEYAKENGVILLLKGTATIVTDGTECWIVPKGSPGMATAGSGDVLSGVLAGIAGYNRASAKMTACGAYITGLAGELAAAEVGEIGMIASDTVRCLAKAIRQLP
ncbi:MAG: NAD(P)H-hydrate dehydratase [Clostridia bacterium]|nr:NAD(P)H-hydrate dehydratase [Clostridia bacterium]